MIKMALFIGVLVLLFSCTEGSDAKKTDSNASMASYFYPKRDTAMIYCYRNIANGLDEEFHRVFSLKDSCEHIIVERYSSSKRFLEAFNYNAKSFEVVEHIVVNRHQEREISKVYHNRFFPLDQQKQSYFAAKFTGINDSTLILKENKRTFYKDTTFVHSNTKGVSARIFTDSIRQTLLNIVSKKERELSNVGYIHFAEGIGPVEWYGSSKKVHYKLEKVISQKEWVRMMQF